MSKLSTRLKMYLPGGGSSGNYGADEAADIDKINQDLEQLDAVVGLPSFPTAARPTTNNFPGRLFKEADSAKEIYFSDGAGNWLNAMPDRLLPTALNIGGLDLNGDFNTGFYQGTGIINAPTSGWYHVQVMRNAPGYHYQRATGFGGSEQITWERWHENGTWQAWQPTGGAHTYALNGVFQAQPNVQFDTGPGYCALEVYGNMRTFHFSLFFGNSMPRGGWWGFLNPGHRPGGTIYTSIQTYDAGTDYNGTARLTSDGLLVHSQTVADAGNDGVVQGIRGTFTYKAVF